MSEAARVLIIEDDEAIRRFLMASLPPDEYEVVVATSAKEGVSLAISHKPRLILLDLGLPDLDGLDLTQEFRTWSRCPIIILSARGNEDDKIRALDMGADDYITKPFSVGELLARMRVAIRNAHTERDDSPIFDNGSIRIDFSKREVSRDNNPVHLTPTEFRLLTVLIQNAGRVITHKQLLSQVWSERQKDELQYLRIYMKQLRHKLEKDPTRPAFFTTEPGIGYRFRI